jgi:hypothetical protein
MADLDVEIDVPDDDDDGLDQPVRVLSGGWLPAWLKALVVLLLGAMLAITVGGYLLGRARAVDDPLPPTTTTSTTAPIASAAASPSIESALQAVEVWETFARTGDLGGIAERFDPDGPQYAVFAEQAQAGDGNDGSEPGTGVEIDFMARNMSEISGDGLVAVSMDLVVSSPTGQAIYPYDLVYLNGSPLVWTVVDRRTPGTVALPPAPATVELASQNWATFAAAVSAVDGPTALGAVSERTVQLATAVAAAVTTGDRSNPAPLTDPELFGLLVERASAAGAEDPGAALISLLDQGQREAIGAGDLALWTQIDPERVIASLEVDGQPVTTVPFIASTGGWVFDLAGALETSQGESA